MLGDVYDLRSPFGAVFANINYLPCSRSVFPAKPSHRRQILMEHILLQLMLSRLGRIFSIHRSKHSLCFLWLALTVAGFPALFAETPKVAAPVIVAYVFPKHEPIQPGAIAARKLTRINFAFALIQSGKIVTEDPSDAANLATLIALKRDNPSLTVLVSAGGWLGSGNFSDMALTKESRQVFIQSVIQFIEQYQLDGLDVDWEYPGMIGAGNKFRPEDKQNYTLVLAELRKQFDQEEKKLHRQLFLTIATGASSEFLEHTEMDKVQKYVDTVNLMAYDYYEPGSDAITGNHAPLFTDPLDPKKISGDRSVHEYEQAGVPAERLFWASPSMDTSGDRYRTSITASFNQASPFRMLMPATGISRRAC